MLKFERQKKLTKRNSEKMIYMLAKHSNHYNDFNLNTDQDVVSAFRRNKIDFSQLIEDCRDPSVNVPFFENQIGSTVHTSGVKVERVNFKTGMVKPIIDGDGTYSEASYWSSFELSLESLDRCIAKTSYPEFLNSTVQLITSIESYINRHVEFWNETHPEDQLIDSRSSKVSIEDKIEKWVPKMSHGHRIDKSQKYWEEFKAIKNIRDNEAIHVKSQFNSVTSANFLKRIHQLQGSILLLIKLHICFGERIPRIIIRAYFSPPVELIKSE